MNFPTMIPGQVAPPSPRRRARGRGWLLHLGLVIGLILLVTAFVWLFLGSFNTTAELRQVPPTWLPAVRRLDNHRDMFVGLDVARFFLNSALVATAVTIGNL